MANTEPGRLWRAHSMSGSNTIFSVKMGNTEPFMFAGVRGQKDWMHGPDKTRLTDRPNGGIFHWSTFALVVAEQAPAPRPSLPPARA